MSNNVISRYRPTYRADEINLIIRTARRGESLGFVGVAGVGKSNIVNFLRNIQQNAPQIDQDVARLHFPIVDASQWQGTPNSLWKMMLAALDHIVREFPLPPQDNKIVPISEDERIFNALQTRLEWICQELKHQVMMVLDDFDSVVEAGPLAMLERLNGLRSEGNRDRLSYLVFSKRLPHILGKNHDLENRSKFYDLFRHNIYALELYTRDDAMRMLKHLNEVADAPLSENHLEQIYQLAGGHAQLLKTVFNIWVQQGAVGIKVNYFASNPDVQQEFRRILMSLHEHEQQVVVQAAQGQPLTETDQAVIDHLARRGLVVAKDPITWFSPLIAQFLKTVEQ